MGDLAFHTFLILFISGLLGIAVGWCFRGVLARFQEKPVVAPAKPKAISRQSPKPKRRPAKKPSSVRKDNLKLISGVGAVLEKKLHKAGITRFSQIAAWKKADTDKFDKVLDFKGRIGREGWVKQAKALSKKNP